MRVSADVIDRNQLFAVRARRGRGARMLPAHRRAFFKMRAPAHTNTLACDRGVFAVVVVVVVSRI